MWTYPRPVRWASDGQHLLRLQKTRLVRLVLVYSGMAQMTQKLVLIGPLVWQVKVTLRVLHLQTRLVPLALPVRLGITLMTTQRVWTPRSRRAARARAGRSVLPRRTTSAPPAPWALIGIILLTTQRAWTPRSRRAARARAGRSVLSRRTTSAPPAPWALIGITLLTT